MSHRTCNNPFLQIQSEFSFLHLAYNVHDGTVTGFDDAHDPVAELYRVRSAYHLVSGIPQFFDGADGQIGVFYCIDDVLTRGLMAMP